MKLIYGGLLRQKSLGRGSLMLVVDQGAVSHNCCWLRPSTAWVAWKVSEDGWEMLYLLNDSYQAHIT